MTRSFCIGHILMSYKIVRIFRRMQMYVLDLAKVIQNRCQLSANFHMKIYFWIWQRLYKIAVSCLQIFI